MQAEDISPEMLLNAYIQGYFPMPEPDGELLWYKPNPRAIFPLDGFHVSSSLKRHMRKFSEDKILINTQFRDVMEACSEREETWIQPAMVDLYEQLFDLGFCHSIEVVRDGKLIGGTYGLQIQGAFFAESMFHRETNASKVALFHLIKLLNQKNFKLLECQFLTPHLSSLGAIEISDEEYMKLLNQALKTKAGI